MLGRIGLSISGADLYSSQADASGVARRASLHAPRGGKALQALQRTVSFPLRASDLDAVLDQDHRTGRTSNAPKLDLTGTWIKDRKASQSMESVLQLMGLHGIVRKAVSLLRGVHIRHDDQSIALDVFSVLGWFKMTERYDLSGAPGSFRRRDLRRGQHIGRVQMLPPPAPPRLLTAQLAQQQQQKKKVQAEVPEGCLPVQSGPQVPGNPRLAVHLSWSEPVGGTGLDVYELTEPDVLHLTTKLKVGAREESCVSIFRRKGGKA
ncbi:hypothetical protein FOA52_013165 [Chlamydomonas sp. UWO 241]|nr:hypothetical protein FOA52_013165 [Chlamydomonas sp. UWO 241]